MKRLEKLFLDNYIDAFYLFSLLTIFAIITLFFRHNFGSMIIDCGREAFFPAEILKGKILYKDLFNIFGPLSYQINSVFYLLFGENLKSLRIAGFLNSSLIICLFYSLTRLFTSRTVSWVINLFIIISCICSFTFFNYIFPYSYSIIYALSGFLFSVLFLLLYLKTSKDYFLPLSWFFAGVSFASKYEYVLYIFFLLFISLFKHPKNKKHLFVSLISFLFVPILSYSLLFFQGLNLNDFLNNLHFLKMYISSPSLKYLYENHAGLYPQKKFLSLFLFMFKIQGIFIICLLCSLYLFFNSKSKEYLIKVLTILISFFCCYFISLSALVFFMTFCCLPLFTLFLFVFLFVKFKENLSLKDFLSTNNGIYMVFILCALLSTLKTFFNLNLYAYGSYTLPLLFIVNSILLIEYLPKWLPFIDKDALKKSFCGVVIILIVPFAITSSLVFTNKIETITPKGTIYDDKNITLTSLKMIHYIDKNIKPDASIWIIPEGTMINFLTNHPSSSIYYAVNTPYLETFGEEKIISDTKKNPPDYIIITNMKSECYGHDVICKDYGFKLCNYIKSSYSPVKYFGNVFSMVLYKRK